MDLLIEFAHIVAVLLPAPLEGPAVLPAADSLLQDTEPGHHLAVVSCESLQTPTLVDSPAVAAVEARHHALAELAPVPVVAGPAVAGVPLDALPAVLAGLGADAALTPRTLEARGTLAHTRGRAVAPVHTLRLTDRAGAMTTFPARPAHTAARPVTVAVIVTDAVTARVLAPPHTLLPQPQLQRRPGQLSLP